ncbi:type II toxin-antitoxin system PemK/MazF family toxin [Deinococcus koreensis]|uniref:type II toxin-antitoxin system PemK/MazF family toxin n=1 Tax=Deinococcus koreensis TaxID=2054903 RepID=UPI0013FE20C8|nr:type II toxin-antitoxin system PemK/MazF family toxin [Deinococcus koreensis]
MTDWQGCQRGEVWQVQFNPSLRSEGKDEHPAVILSIDQLNRSRMPLTTIIPFTSAVPRYEGMLNVRVEPDASNGLTKISWAQPHMIRAVNRELRLVRRRGALAEADFARIQEAVRDVLGL